MMRLAAKICHAPIALQHRDRPYAGHVLSHGTPAIDRIERAMLPGMRGFRPVAVPWPSTQVRGHPLSRMSSRRLIAPGGRSRRPVLSSATTCSCCFHAARGEVDSRSTIMMRVRDSETLTLSSLSGLRTTAKRHLIPGAPLLPARSEPPTCGALCLKTERVTAGRG
jgi:hypothetical protein